MDAAVLESLRRELDQQGAEMPPRDRVMKQLEAFREIFGVGALGGLDGEPLLRRLHGRMDEGARCLAYWLEFKDDAEFEGSLYGGIGGGSALKFGLFQDKAGDWITGSSKKKERLDTEAAVSIARRQRDELLAAAEVLARWNPADIDDAAGAELQRRMTEAAPATSSWGWAHKYWFLLQPERLDVSHSAQWQRFHLLKLLDMPPDGIGTRYVSDAGRFNCAGRFVRLAQALKLTQVELGRLLNMRHGTIHRYWKVGTTEGDTGRSHWQEMRDGNFVSIGWPDLGDLTELLSVKDQTLREAIQQKLTGNYSLRQVQSRKAGEICGFVQEMAPGDIVLACDGQQVLGIGRVDGGYQHHEGRRFPHHRPVRWFELGAWKLPENEGPQTTVFELGRRAGNILAIEQRLASAVAPTTSVKLSTTDAHAGDSLEDATPPTLPPLEPMIERIDSILRRKGQVILYGPPGTGKTWHAMRAARELAARHIHQRSWRELSPGEQQRLSGPNGQIRVCTFHPGWSYELFVEGLQPDVRDGPMVFRPADGLFKRLCLDARADPDRHYFLVMDEINRADVPRVFGELLSALEFDKRGNEFELPVTGSRWTVPRNVFLLGTMNTADRSISLLDTALRRRFGFIELMPDAKALKGQRVGDLVLGPWLDALNLRLRTHLKRDARNLQIGHSFLLSPTAVSSLSELVAVLRDDIIPLLEEYCYEDYPTLERILGQVLVDVKALRIRDELFEPSRGLELLQGLAFEEMSEYALDEPSSDEVRDEIADDADDAQVSATDAG